MRTVTVLGAGGFLGSAVSEALCDREIRLRLVGRSPIEPPADCAADVSTHRADVTDPDQLAPLLVGSDVVLFMLKPTTWRHTGAIEEAEAVNVGPMRTIVRTFADGPGTPLCVYAGSTGQIGTPPSHPMDGTEVDRPVSDYDRQKCEAERIMLAAHEQGTLRGVSLRLCHVFGRHAGGGVDRGIVGLLIRRALAGEPLTVWGDGTVNRDLLYVEDCVRAFVAAMDGPAALQGRSWVIGSGEAWSLTRLFGKVADAVAAHTGRPAVPVVPVPPPEHALATDMCSATVDPGPFATASGWSARIPVDEGVDRAVAAIAGDLTRTTGTEERT